MVTEVEMKNQKRGTWKTRRRPRGPHTRGGTVCLWLLVIVLWTFQSWSTDWDESKAPEILQRLHQEIQSQGGKSMSPWRRPLLIECTNIVVIDDQNVVMIRCHDINESSNWKDKNYQAETSLCPTRGASSVFSGKGGLGHSTGSQEGWLPPHVPR